LRLLPTPAALSCPAQTLGRRGRQAISTFTISFCLGGFTRTVAHLYRCRWQVELFFKWIKQHLRIKSLFGTFENAVKTQIWIAVSV
jgi:IS4 transposase